MTLSCEPFLFYFIGYDKKIPYSSYLCSLMGVLEWYQIHNTYHRVQIICNADFPKVCHKTQYKTHNQGKTISPLVPFYSITTLAKLSAMIQNVLVQKCIPGITPIIIVFDGHGYVNVKNVSVGFTKTTSIIGNMVMGENMDLDEMFFPSVFGQEFMTNYKLFVLTQCGSFNFAQRLLPLVPHSVIITSTDKPSICSYGVPIFHVLKEAVELKVSTFLTLEFLCIANNLGIFYGMGMDKQTPFFYFLNHFSHGQIKYLCKTKLSQTLFNDVWRNPDNIRCIHDLLVPKKKL